MAKVNKWPTKETGMTASMTMTVPPMCLYRRCIRQTFVLLLSLKAVLFKIAISIIHLARKPPQPANVVQVSIVTCVDNLCRGLSNCFKKRSQRVAFIDIGNTNPRRIG